MSSILSENIYERLQQYIETKKSKKIDYDKLIRYYKLYRILTDNECIVNVSSIVNELCNDMSIIDFEEFLQTSFSSTVAINRDISFKICMFLKSIVDKDNRNYIIAYVRKTIDDDPLSNMDIENDEEAKENLEEIREKIKKLRNENNISKSKAILVKVISKNNYEIDSDCIIKLYDENNPNKILKNTKINDNSFDIVFTNSPYFLTFAYNYNKNVLEYKSYPEILNEFDIPLITISSIPKNIRKYIADDEVSLVKEYVEQIIGNKENESEFSEEEFATILHIYYESIFTSSDRCKKYISTKINLLYLLYLLPVLILTNDFDNVDFVIDVIENIESEEELEKIKNDYLIERSIVFALDIGNYGIIKRLSRHTNKKRLNNMISSDGKTINILRKTIYEFLENRIF